MRSLLIASALGLGVLAGGAAVQPADAAPFNAGQVEFGLDATPAQYYRRGYYPRPYYGPRRYYGPRAYYGPPPRYGYYAPPPPRYYAPRPYYRRW